VLLDVVPSQSLAATVRQRLEVGEDRVSDLHLWRLGPGHTAVAASIVTDRPMPPDHYKTRLRGMDGLSHLTIEVQPSSYPK
jgi:Co/Zn/Cd efflux system component